MRHAGSHAADRADGNRIALLSLFCTHVAFHRVHQQSGSGVPLYRVLPLTGAVTEVHERGRSAVFADSGRGGGDRFVQRDDVRHQRRGDRFAREQARVIGKAHHRREPHGHRTGR